MLKKFLCALLLLTAVISLISCNNKINKAPDEPLEKICRINFFASNGSYDKRFLMMNLGHSFVSVENLSGEELLVGNYTLAPGEEATFSIWPVSGYSGVWYNIESAMIASEDKYSDRVSVSFYIGRERLGEISAFLNEEHKWELFYNCSAFTLDIFNIVTRSEGVYNPYAPLIVTPSALVKLFRQYEFEIERSIAENDNIGFFRKGVFERCELSY